jgi:hypothetical protein
MFYNTILVLTSMKHYRIVANSCVFVCYNFYSLNNASWQHHAYNFTHSPSPALPASTGTLGYLVVSVARFMRPTWK